jgi:hypothetical protein
VDWISVILWGLVAVVALPLAAGVVMGALPLGLQPVCALGGFAATVIFIAVGGSTTLAWVAFALAVGGVLLTTLGAAELIEHPSDTVIPGEEAVASLAGAALPLYAVQATIALIVAVGGVNLTG